MQRIQKLLLTSVCMLLVISACRTVVADNIFTGNDTVGSYKFWVVEHDETNPNRTYKAFVFTFKYSNEDVGGVPVIHVRIWGYRSFVTKVGGKQYYTDPEELTVSGDGPLRGLLNKKENGRRERHIVQIDHKILINGTIYDNKVKVRNNANPMGVEVPVKALFHAIQSRALDKSFILYGKKFKFPMIPETGCEEPPVEDVLEPDPALENPTMTEEPVDEVPDIP